MIGGDRLLQKLYSELAQHEKKLWGDTVDVQDIQGIEQLETKFAELTQLKLDMASKSSIASALRSLKHDTKNYALSNIA